MFKQPAVIAALFVVAAASLGDAQVRRPERPGWPIYDAKTETTIKGTIEEVETISGPGRRSAGGTHLLVNTESEKLEVHVGPTAYLAGKQISIAKGDAVEILGSLVTLGEKPVLIARRMTKGNQTWVLRDASGRPVWSGGRR
jgi:hypothetical protein